MLNFKQFLKLNEEVGLGDLGSKINSALQDRNLENRIGSWLTSDWTGREAVPNYNWADGGHSLHLPGHDFVVPQVVKNGRIITLQKNRNPIYVRLTDGTQLYLTYDQYRRVEGSEPAIGKVMTVIFQRHPSDKTENKSKIDKVIVRG